MVSGSSCFQCHRSHTFDHLGDHAPPDGRSAKSRGAPRDSTSVHAPIGLEKRSARTERRTSARQFFAV
jgi:hypothetical protein